MKFDLSGCLESMEAGVCERAYFTAREGTKAVQIYAVYII